MWAESNRWKKVSLSLQTLSESITGDAKTYETLNNRRQYQRPIRYERLHERRLFAGDLSATQAFQMTVAATQAAQYGPQQWNPEAAINRAINDIVDGQFSATAGQAAVPSAIASMYAGSDSSDRSMCVGDLAEQTAAHISQMQASIAQYQQLIANASADMIAIYESSIALLNTQIADAQAFLDYLNQVCGTSGSNGDDPVDNHHDWNDNSTAGSHGTSFTSGSSNDDPSQNTTGTYNNPNGNDDPNTGGPGSTHGTAHTSFTSGTKGTHGTANTQGTDSTGGTQNTNGTGNTLGTNPTNGTGNTQGTSTTQGTNSTSGSSGTGNSQGTNVAGNSNVCPGATEYKIDRVLSPSSYVVEGSEFALTALACGPTDSSGYLIDPPKASVWIDFNFNQARDADEYFPDITVDPLYRTISISGKFLDDGPSPGNGTAQDNAKAEIRFGAHTHEQSITVANAIPLATSNPNIEVKLIEGAGGNITYEAKIDAYISDAGVKDLHRMKVEWFDGQQVVTPWTDSKQLSAVYTVTINRHGPTYAHKPLKLTFEDDDRGQSTFIFDTLDIGLNDNDDNHNRKPDYDDNYYDPLFVPYVDPDLVSLDIGSALTTLQSLPPGRVFVENDRTKVSLWSSRDKSQSLLELTSDWLSQSGQIWAEGVTEGPTEFSIYYQNESIRVPLASFKAFVWNADLDIDSDNNNGTTLPDQSGWEEELEDHEYGLGKLVFPHDTAFTPVILQLPKGINPALTDVRVRFEFMREDTSGRIDLWNRDMSDPRRVASADSPRDGGNMLYPFQEYTLKEINYDPTTGHAIVFIDSISANPKYYSKMGVDMYGKPDDRIKALLLTADNRAIDTDDVKYLSTETDSFFANLQRRREVRSAIASDGVYSLTDLPQFAMRKVPIEELLRLGFSTRFTNRLGQPMGGMGFKSTVYFDYIGANYTLAMAGTEPSIRDLATDIIQAISFYSTQYDLAIDMGYELTKVRLNKPMIITGHSLGGGLASATAIISGLEADTFNAAGVNLTTLLRGAVGTEIVAITGRYISAPSYINAYFVQHEVLSFLQDGSITLPNALGLRIMLPGPYDSIPFVQISLLHRLLAHRMISVFDGLLADRARGWNAHGYPILLQL